MLPFLKPRHSTGAKEAGYATLCSGTTSALQSLDQRDGEYHCPVWQVWRLGLDEWLRGERELQEFGPWERPGVRFNQPFLQYYYDVRYYNLMVLHPRGSRDGSAQRLNPKTLPRWCTLGAWSQAEKRHERSQRLPAKTRLLRRPRSLSTVGWLRAYPSFAPSFDGRSYVQPHGDFVFE